MSRLRGTGASDRGSLRPQNEVAWQFHDDDDAALAIVADGMGGHTSGCLAADLAVATSASVFARRVAVYAETWWKAEHTPLVRVRSYTACIDERRRT